MTAVTAPPRLRRSGTEPATRRSGTPLKPAARRAATRPAARPPVRAVPVARSRSGTRVTVFVALAIVFVLVSAVVFHVILAQGQLQLDHLDTQIAAERREYEQRRLATSQLASPQRITEEAQRQGLVVPAEPPIYFEVPGATVPAGRAAQPPSTLDDWREVKPSLGDNQP
jgi:cell division protein FtsL